MNLGGPLKGNHQLDGVGSFPQLVPKKSFDSKKRPFKFAHVNLGTRFARPATGTFWLVSGACV